MKGLIKRAGKLLAEVDALISIRERPSPYSMGDEPICRSGSFTLIAGSAGDLKNGSWDLETDKETIKDCSLYSETRFLDGKTFNFRAPPKDKTLSNYLSAQSESSLKS